MSHRIAWRRVLHSPSPAACRLTPSIVAAAVAMIAAFLQPNVAVAGGPQLPVVPLVGCTAFTEDPVNGTLMTVLFGYDNPNPQEVVLPFGENNFFVPSSVGGNRPVTFAPGRHATVFQVVIDPSFTPQLEWHLDGVGLPVTAATGPHCVQAVLALAATGDGTVAADAGSLSCSDACSQAYDVPSELNLLAAPASGWSFSGWGGDPDCADGVVTFDAVDQRSCIAHFEPPVTRTLALAAAGPGSLVVTGASVSCPPGPCLVDVDDGSVVTLTPVPDGGGQFVAWIGDPDCDDGSLTMDGDRLCVASFQALPADIFADGFESGDLTAWSGFTP